MHEQVRQSLVALSLVASSLSLAAHAEPIPGLTFPGASASTAISNYCAATPGDIDLALPQGSFKMDTPVTACGNRNLHIHGVGIGLTNLVVSHPGIVFDIKQASTTQTVTIDNLGAASTSPTGTDALLRVTYPLVVSSAHSTVFMHDVEMTGPTNLNVVAGTWCKGLILYGAWSVRLKDNFWTGRPAYPAPVGCSFLDAAEVFDVFLESNQQFNGYSSVYLSGYAEGIRFINPTVIGATWLLDQAPTGITLRAGYSLLGLWFSGGEISTFAGGLRLREAKVGLIRSNHFYRWSAPALISPQWVGYDLTGVSLLNSNGDLFQGGAAAAGITSIRIRAGALGSVGNTWANPTFTAQATAIDFGPGTSGNAIIGAFADPGLVWRDEGKNNTQTHHTATGAP